MGATAHLYLPVYDKIQITTSYEYLEIRQLLNPWRECDAWMEYLCRRQSMCLLLFKGIVSRDE
jgi:hypothetical protein